MEKTKTLTAEQAEAARYAVGYLADQAEDGYCGCAEIHAELATLAKAIGIDPAPFLATVEI